MNLFTKQNKTHWFGEGIYDCQGRNVVGGSDRLGICDWQVHTDIFKIDNQRGLTIFNFA